MASKRYTAIFHTGNKNKGNNGYMKWRNITNIDRLYANIVKIYPEAKFCHVYDKKTKDRIDYRKFD